jgi:DNA (cytosine-5)-methyltransferase 1
MEQHLRSNNVDTNTINHVSLCSGYGGIDLGLKRAIGSHLRTVAFVEIEAFAAANLAAKAEAGLLDNAPIWSDLKRFPWGKFHGLVDILSGGYPCQPFSAAGKRLGAEDPRHLWPFIAAGIAAMRPSCCFFENVEGHISLGLPNVLQDLAGMGYRTTWCVASASECGAPHQRKRVFILAHRNGNGFLRHVAESSAIALGNQSQDGVSGAHGAMADSQCTGLEGFHNWHASTVAAQHVGADAWASGERGAWPSRPGEQQFAWEPPRVVVDAKSQRAGQRSELRSEECGSRGALPWDVEQSDQTVGNAQRMRPQGRNDTGSLQAMGISRAEFTGANGQHNGRQAQSSLGGSLNGPANRLGHAVLHVSTDNRTDELRLLGNGVVPATSERAFRVLIGELMEEAP